MFIGRNDELLEIQNQLKDRNKAQLLILYGRRRIGKSRLIEEAVDTEKQVLFFEGIQGERSAYQVSQFLDDLSRQTKRARLRGTTWAEAFRGLGEVVADGRWVVVFDEFPWMGAGRTRIVSELKLHWDRWKNNTDLVLFLCGSVASFMTKHVLHSQALHNRKTFEMNLGPLSPREAGEFISRRSLREKAQLYMCLGGVPKYLEQIDPKQSVEKNLNRLAFTRNGFFVTEFETLFKEQFRSVKNYEAITCALAEGPKDLTSLAALTGTSRGGGFQAQVDNLVQAEFVREYRPVKVGPQARTRTIRYRLVDPFLLFYFRYVHANRALIAKNRNENLFRAIVGPTQHQYYGYAWERLCEDALGEILRKLDLSLADILYMGPYFQRPLASGQGLQIDWLIARRDDVWTVIEYKYTKQPIPRSILTEMQTKIARLNPPDSVTIEPVLVTASGVTPSVTKAGYFSAVLELDDLV